MGKHEMPKKVQKEIDKHLSDRKKGKDLSDGKSKAEKGTQDYEDFQTGQKIMRDASEKIGEKAAIATIKKQFPNAKIIHKGKGAGTFDLVFEDGGKFYIVEAKGGSSSLGFKNVEGVLEQQGIMKYKNAIIKKMKMSNNPDQVSIANKLSDAFDEEITYFQGKTKIDDNGKVLNTELEAFN